MHFELTKKSGRKLMSKKNVEIKDGDFVYIDYTSRIKENNQLLDQMSSIDDSLEKLKQNSKKISDQVGLIWLTILGYIIYLEFFK